MNANPSDTIGISPFFATNGFEPYMSFDLQPDIAPLPLGTTREANERKRAEKVAKGIVERS